MIRNDNEYARARERLEQERGRLETFKEQFGGEFAPDEVGRLMEPLVSFYEQLVDEVRVYERLKRGDLGDLKNLHGLGRLLVHLRVAASLTQRQLAERLEVHESQVSRDERNEYHGITLERASKIIDAIGLAVRTQVIFQCEPRARWSPAFDKVTESTRQVIAPAKRGSPLSPPDKVYNADFPDAA
ncbi:MAG TPA: helix-turn-helix domain-containing protein [Thermoanaerobaculia bacterium]|nr:helix-turn-helix domain-containing protein [Thermoanaerobaculia bacterium]